MKADPQVFVAQKGPKKGHLAVIFSKQEGDMVSYLCLTQAEGYASGLSHPPVHIVQTSAIEFGTFYVADPSWPIDKLADVYKQHAIKLGASPEALALLERIITFTPEEFDMATAKTAAAAKTPVAKPGKTNVKPKSAPAKTVATEQAEKPAPAEKPTKASAPKAEKTAAPKAEKTSGGGISGFISKLIMEGKLTDDQIFAEAQKQFNLDDGKRGYVSWNRNNLKKKGMNPPDSLGGRSNKAASAAETKTDKPAKTTKVKVEDPATPMTAPEAPAETAAPKATAKKVAAPRKQKAA